MSVDKEQRQALRFLDGLRTVAEMMQLESGEQSSSSNEQYCSMIRTYFEKADDPDKALLCSMKPFMMALVAQLQSPGDSLNQSQSSIGSHTPNESKEADVNCYKTNINLGKNGSNMLFNHEEETEKVQTTLNENHEVEERINAATNSSSEAKDASFHEQVPFSSSSAASPLSYQEDRYCMMTNMPTQCNESSIYNSKEESNGNVSAKTKLSTSEDEYSDITKKIQDISLDDVDGQEQPVNYSLKYPEESSTSSDFSPHQSKRNFNLSSKSGDNVSEERMYNAYAETDLDNMDQPIDYSQKYHEYIHDDSPPSIHFNRPSPSRPLKESCKLSCSYEDTIKVFCTEDTPLNFSSASSLTDLRDIGLSGLQTPNSCFDETLEKSPEIMHILKEDTAFRNCTDVGSRFLSTVEENEEVIKESRTGHDSNIPVSEEITSKNDGEVSVDETPLMFSRSSSLCSLNSFEQQSIHDDRSSVSDFSHVPSGVVSPSDLPDSPLCYTPKVLKDEDTPVAFSFCDTLSPLQSRDKSVLSTNGKITIKYPPNCISTLTNGSISEERSISQQHTTPNWHPSKADLSHFSENIAMKKVMRINNDANQPSFAHNRTPVLAINRLSYPNETLNTDGYDTVNSAQTDHFENYGKESTFQAQHELELSEKAVVEQYISFGMPVKQSGKRTTAQVPLIQIEKSTACDSSYSEQVHRQLPNESTVGSSLVLNSTSVQRGHENYLSHEHTSPQIFRERQESPDIKTAVCESVTTPKTGYQELLKTNIAKKCEITPSEKALLEEYILFGMPRNASETISPKLHQTTRQLASATQSSPPYLKSANHVLPNNVTPLAAERPLKIQTAEPAKSSKTTAVESSNTAAAAPVDLLKDSSGLSAADRAMLNEVISFGMPEHKFKIR